MKYQPNLLLLLFVVAFSNHVSSFDLDVNTFLDALHHAKGSSSHHKKAARKGHSTSDRNVEPNESDPRFYSPLFNSTIIGKNMATIKGKPIYAFQGFKYGQEPDAETRFKPPIPAGKFWKGNTFVANHIGFKCPQPSLIGTNPSGEEDCLVLNAYTPHLPSPESKEKLPVMFFIHGGAFIMGDTSMYLPTKLLERDVILVTIHYRLGAFGFFSLNNSDAPGNTAFYDMIEALRWTHKYIGDFGGDKDKVTIFGESAGAVSVNYLTLIPAARGLFRAVIAESGSALDHWAIDDDPSYAAHYIAKFLNCPTDNDERLFHCVARADAYDLVRAQDSLVVQDRHEGLMGFRGVSPVVQSFELTDTDDFELLVTKHPMEYYRAGEFAQVPILTGSNRDEGSFVLGIMYEEHLTFHHLLNNQTYMREQMVQDIIRSYGVDDPTFSLATSLAKYYCPDVDLGDFDAAAPCLIDMVGVIFLKAGSWQTVKLRSYYSDQPTFYYSFEVESDDSMYGFIMGTPPFEPGITHSDDLMYIFSMPVVLDAGVQQLTMDRMVRIWTNFAIYGHPTPEEDRQELDRLRIPNWTPLQYDKPHFMIMSDEFTIGDEYSDRWRRFGAPVENHGMKNTPAFFAMLLISLVLVVGLEFN